MKLCTIVLCVGVLQIYSISGQSGPRGPISREQRARYFLNALKGVGTQFVDDVSDIINKFKDNAFVMDYIIGILDISGEVLDGRGRTIDVSNVRNHSKDLPNEYRVIDDANILEALLLRQMPSERINGVLALLFAFRSGATNEEIENALGYMYGTKTNVSRPNFPALDTQMCSTQRESAYLEMLSSNAHNFLKSIVDVNPKVLQDLSNILEKFPCNYWIAGPLAGFADELKNNFHADTSKIDVCMIQGNWKRHPDGEDINLVNWSDVLSMVLSTRLPDEEYNGLIGVMQTIRTNVSTKEIENALAYLYGPQENDLKPTC